MRFKGLIAATIVLAALGGALYWSNQKEKTDARKPATAGTRILRVEPADLQKVETKRRDGETVVLERDKAGEWTITAPSALRTDSAAANIMVNQLATVTADKLVDEKPSDLAQFGFSNPVIEFTLVGKNGKASKILLGDDVPTGGGTFIKAQDDPKVYTILQPDRVAIDLPVSALRDKRMVIIPVDKIAKVELAAKGQTTEFSKTGKGDWAIVKPKPMRADGMQVDELVRKLLDARADFSATPEDAKKAGAAFASAAPVAVAKLTGPEGVQTIEVRNSKEEYYARGSAQEGVFKVPPEFGKGLDKKPEDFRNRKVFDFGFTDVGKLEVRDGPRNVQFVKAGEKWMSGAQEMDVVGVQSFIDKLRETAAVKFAEQAFPAPMVDVTVSFGKNTEKVLFAAVGDKTFAKRDGEPAVYELEGKALEELRKALDNVKPVPVPKDAKKK